MDISQYEAIQKTEPNSPDEQFVKDQDFSTMVENKYDSPSITSQNAPFLSDAKLKQLTIHRIVENMEEEKQSPLIMKRNSAIEMPDAGLILTDAIIQPSFDDNQNLIVKRQLSSSMSSPELQGKGQTQGI